MAVTLEDLDRRLSQVEQELARLQAKERPPARLLTAAERGAEALRRAQESQPEISAMWEQVAKKMGLPTEPSMSVQELRASMIASGINPEDNEFSRGIIEMREE